MNEAETKWTPGPWFVRPSSSGIAIWARTPARELDAGTFGTRARRERPVVTTANAHSRPDERHNAHLIAAAPEEDAALLKAVMWGERYGEQVAIKAGLGVGEWESCVPPWWHEANAALAKARGDDPTPPREEREISEETL